MSDRQHLVQEANRKVNSHIYDRMFGVLLVDIAEGGPLCDFFDSTTANFQIEYDRLKDAGLSDYRIKAATAVALCDTVDTHRRLDEFRRMSPDA